MALGILVLFFIGISVVSIAGLLALFLVKNEEARKVIFYLMSIWASPCRLCGPTRSRPTGWDSGFSRWDSAPCASRLWRSISGPPQGRGDWRLTCSSRSPWRGASSGSSSRGPLDLPRRRPCLRPAGIL